VIRFVYPFALRQDRRAPGQKSAKRRIGLAVRVIVPIVKVLDWDAPLHELIVVHGEDTVQFNTR